VGRRVETGRGVRVKVRVLPRDGSVGVGGERDRR
ncbi:MAG: hypothetical protein RLZZ244_375, partial [Verrucomicrobiota bacterium]